MSDGKPNMPSSRGPGARPPHPATIQRPAAAAQPSSGAQRPPHPATIQRPAATAQPSSGAQRPPHPATIQRPAATAQPSSGAQRPPHPATIQRDPGPTGQAKRPVQRAVLPSRVLVYDKTMPKTDPLHRCRYLVADPGGRVFVFGVVSVADMVTKLAACAPIGHLTICGHGLEGMIGVGSGESGDYQAGKDIAVHKLGDVGPSLTTLAELLAADAWVFLMGCHVGAEEDGEALLEQLSARLPGRRILASEKYLEPVKGDTSVEIHSAGGNNLKKGGALSIYDLKIAIDGELSDDGADLPQEDDLAALSEWPANKKAKEHN